MKKNISFNIINLLLLIFICSAINGCKKTSSIEDNTQTLPPATGIDFTTKVSSSVSGFVTNENNLPVQSATVKVGSVTTTTNRYGFFEVRNVQVVKTAAIVTVVNVGYFNGIKTYLAEEGKLAFFRIKLLPKTNIGTFAASTGGTVTSANNVKITLPSNAVVNATTNAAYTGVVSVSAKWIDPTSAELNNIMPGDLRGIDVSNGLKLLTTYGMAAVELTGSAGELLQIATGKKATLTMPIPASILATAPASIPLWYFDEAKGLWKEEGSATKTGNEYIGDVSHFSFWNCDRATPYIIFNGTVTNSSGLPIVNALVRIFLASQPNDIRFGFTDENGYITGAVPVNSQLVLQVYGEWGCNAPLFSQNFITASTNVSLGNLILPASSTAEISGKIVDCNAVGVANGSLIMMRNGLYTRYPVSNIGQFAFVTSVCSSGNSITLIGQDLTANIESPQTNFTLNSGINNLNNLTACTIATTQFVNYSVNGNSSAFSSPADNIGLNSGSGFEIFAYRIPTSNIFTRFKFSFTGIALNTNVPLLTFNSSEILANASVTPNSVMVHITEYGPSLTGYISGNFSGIINNISSPSNPYTIQCNFRVLRWF